MQGEHHVSNPTAKTYTRSRGPEIENWFGVEDGIDPAADNDWSFLPFMALSDGAHTYETSQLELSTC